VQRKARDCSDDQECGAGSVCEDERCVDLKERDNEASPHSKRLRTGDVLLGGTMAFSYAHATGMDAYTVNLSTDIQGLVSNVVAVGGFLTVGVQGQSNATVGTIAAGPRFASYFPAGDAVYPFLALGVGYLHLFLPGSSSGADGLLVEPDLGVAFLVRPGLMIRTGVGYAYEHVASGGQSLDIHGILFGVGIVGVL
jgi:hypothetical protein